MTFYNANKYIQEAIQSILDQDFTDFELLLIDDGSTDNSALLVEEFTDPRIRMLHNEENSGPAYSSNRGFALSQGVYIARMDADDISLPQRLSRQVKFMDSNQHIGICGSSIRYCGHKSGTMRCTCDTDAIKATLFWNTAFAHPSVIIRRAMLEQYKLKYNPLYRYGAMDYDLFNEASHCFPMANLPDVMLKYRVNSQSISCKQATVQFDNSMTIIKNNFLRIGYPYSDELDTILRNNLYLGKPIHNIDQLFYFEQVLLELRRLNTSRQLYPASSFNKSLCEKLFRVCVKSAHLGWTMYNLYRKSPVGGLSHLTMEQRLRLTSKVIGNTLGIQDELG